VADFRSALYLGLSHPAWSLPDWPALTAGVPAALGAPVGARPVTAGLAALTGTEAAILARSTLHALWDLIGALATSDTIVALDAAAYPTAHWAAARAVARRVPVIRFAHRNPEDLIRRLRRPGLTGRRSLVLTDGWCAGCNRPAPLPGLLRAVRGTGGLLVIDDTQALGVLGAAPSAREPFGRGGGGSLRWQHVDPAGIVVVASLAKAFGAPLAVVAGADNVVARLARPEGTRVHSSPPTAADLAAARRALRVTSRDGDARRRRLAQRVDEMRTAARSSGFDLVGDPFPVVSLAAADPGRAAAELRQRGVRALVQRPVCLAAPVLTFLLRADHNMADTARAAAALADVARAEAQDGAGRRQRELMRPLPPLAGHRPGLATGAWSLSAIAGPPAL
jgi:8-amino-7-oxononanoate synthase